MKYKLVYRHLGFYFVSEITKEQAEALKNEDWIIVNDSHFKKEWRPMGDETSTTNEYEIIKVECGEPFYGFIIWNYDWDVSRTDYWGLEWDSDRSYTNYKEYVNNFMEYCKKKGARSAIIQKSIREIKRIKKEGYKD